MNQLQHLMSRILRIMEQAGGNPEQISKSSLDSGSTSPRSTVTDPGHHSSSSRTTFPSPSILIPNGNSPSSLPDRNDVVNNFLREPTANHLCRPPEPLQLPSPSIDPFGFDFEQDLPDLTLHPNFLTKASNADFPYARAASSEVQHTFIHDITEGRSYIEMSVLGSNYGKRVY
jgi:hypothetical protein